MGHGPEVSIRRPAWFSVLPWLEPSHRGPVTQPQHHRPTIHRYIRRSTSAEYSGPWTEFEPRQALESIQAALPGRIQRISGTLRRGLKNAFLVANLVQAARTGPECPAAGSCTSRVAGRSGRDVGRTAGAAGSDRAGDRADRLRERGASARSIGRSRKARVLIGLFDARMFFGVELDGTSG